MHLLQPLVVVASLGSALASPLLITGLEKAPARIEEAGKGGNINPNCPADRVKGIEKLVFEDSIEEFEKARNATLASKEQPCHLWHSDGCTKSLDKPWGCNFTPACHRHDFAWNNFLLHHAYTKSNKERAEDQFEKDMRNVCKSKGKVQRWFCNRTAGLYKWAVKHYPANKPTDPEPPLV